MEGPDLLIEFSLIVRNLHFMVKSRKCKYKIRIHEVSRAERSQLSEERHQFTFSKPFLPGHRNLIATYICCLY